MNVNLRSGPRERHVVGGMARRRHRLQRPAVAGDGLAVLHLHVGTKIAVGAGLGRYFLALVIRPRGAMRALGIDRGAGGRLDPRGVRRMVAVGMGDENMRDGLAAHGVEQRGCVGLVIGTGIDDRDIASADDVAHRAGEGERRRVVAEHAANAGAHLVDDAGFQGKIAVERDVVVVGHEECLLLMPSWPDACAARSLRERCAAEPGP